MDAYDKINGLNEVVADLNDAIKAIEKLGNLNANITGPIYDALYQIEIALEFQQDIVRQMPKSEVELRYERLAAKYGAKRVKRVCYETMLKEMNGGAAV